VRAPQEEYDERADGHRVEHFAKKTMSQDDKMGLYRNVMQHASAMLRGGSGPERVLFSTLHFEHRAYLPTLDTWQKLASAFANNYLLDRHDSGNYPLDDRLVDAASDVLTRIDSRDAIEDYRWLSIINPDHFGMWSISWDLPRIAFALRLALTDPFWAHKWLYYALDVWMWQFGGTSRQPIVDGRVRPVKLRLLLFERKRPSPYR